MESLNLENLYVGFVNSYNSLLLASENGRTNIALDTHAIIDWFRRAGITFGFYPCCEHKRRDLEWYSEKEENKALLHLESENFFSKITNTIDKMIKSDAHYRIGIVWSDELPEDIESQIRKLEQQSEGNNWESLLIVRFTDKAEKDREGYWYCPVKAWLIRKGNKKELPSFYIRWPNTWGLQTAIWEPDSSTNE